MKVALTGASGFTGHYVMNALAASGHEAVAVSSNLMDAVGLQAEIKAMQPDAIIHLAALAFVAHGDANAFYQVNLVGTRNLLDAIWQSGAPIKSVLLASSANVYGGMVEGALSEEQVLAPQNDYAVSKTAMELMAATWSDRLPLFIARPFNYTGVGQKENFLIPKLIAHFAKCEKQISLGNMDVRREFNDVRMVADIYVRLLELAPVGETINVCTGIDHSLNDVVAMLENVCGYKIDVNINPRFVRENEVRLLKGNNTKLHSLLGALPEYTLHDTLTWMLRG